MCLFWPLNSHAELTPPNNQMLLLPLLAWETKSYLLARSMKYFEIVGNTLLKVNFSLSFIFYYVTACTYIFFLHPAASSFLSFLNSFSLPDVESQKSAWVKLLYLELLLYCLFWFPLKTSHNLWNSLLSVLETAVWGKMICEQLSATLFR